jgi:phosphotransferase system enzyme I (PtsI)
METTKTSLKGIAASGGIAIGTAVIWHARLGTNHETSIRPDDVAVELEQLTAAVAAANKELHVLAEQTRQRLGDKEAEIFETHGLLLEDPEFIGVVQEKIRCEFKSATSAVAATMDGIIALFAELDDEYLSARSADIRDVSRRIMRHLAGTPGVVDEQRSGPFIVLADDLTPSDTAGLDPQLVAGFATRIGGYTSHSSILARSYGIPAIVGLGPRLEIIQEGDLLILDGNEGLLHLAVDEAMVQEYRNRMEEQQEQQRLAAHYLHKPTQSRDGCALQLKANIGSAEDATLAKAAGAEGIGLFRTEFLYMGRDSLPTEEEQYTAYCRVAQAFPDSEPIIIRTLDIGGDKTLPYLSLPVEANPFLGQRAIRLCLAHEDIFRTQLRAILRASVAGNVNIMFPMIATLAEWRKAKSLVHEVQEELRAAGIPFRENLPLGIMIEIPAAALMAERFAREVDFFSIGTNDLVQYTMAADRMNEALAYLTDPFHPAVLSLIAGVIQAAQRHHIPVSMCGEMAGTREALPLLLGLGLQEFSMGKGVILPARALLAQLDSVDTARLAEEALLLDSAEEIKELCARYLTRLTKS